MHDLPPFDERRREIALARLRVLLPRLYGIVRHELAYREAIGDLLPDALKAENVVDAVVPAAYLNLVSHPNDSGIASQLRRMALDQIDADTARLRTERSAARQVEDEIPATPPPEQAAQLGEGVLYFFEPGAAADAETLKREAAVPQSDQDQLRRCLESALAAMPPIWRRALLLRHIDGLAGAALARAIGRPEREIGLMLQHAQAYLREQLFSSEYTAAKSVPTQPAADRSVSS